MCKKGGCINRIHKAIAHLLAVFCREAGFDARLEMVIPEFVRTRAGYEKPVGLSSREYNQMEQGILDVVASHPFDSTEFLLDATVRHPMSSNSVRLAPTIPGAAALHGEHDKLLRYPASRGRCVTPCAIETWGRIGPSMYSFLESLSAAAQRRDLAHSLPRGLYLQKWLTMLSCTLNKAISRAIFDSLYFSSPSPSASLDPSTVLSTAQVNSALASATGPYGHRLFPFPAQQHTHTSPAAAAHTAPPPTPAIRGMRALFPELRTFAASADPVVVSPIQPSSTTSLATAQVSMPADHTTTSPSSSSRAGGAAGGPANPAAPILAPANRPARDPHEEDPLRVPAAEGLLNAAPLHGIPPLVDAVAIVSQHS